MRPVVLVPFRGGEPHRDAAWSYVRTFWQQFDWPMVLSEGPPGPFHRAAARNQAAEGDWEVAVFADADTIGEPKKIRRAVEVAQTGMLAYPFNLFSGLSQGQTKAFMAGKDPGVGKRKQGSPGGIFAISRALWDEVGGYDEAFTGWGYEDLAFMYAAGTLGGLYRERGTITHLWHPLAKDKRDAIAGKNGNRARKDRYAEANGKPDAMRALLAELR